MNESFIEIGVKHEADPPITFHVVVDELNAVQLGRWSQSYAATGWWGEPGSSRFMPFVVDSKGLIDFGDWRNNTNIPQQETHFGWERFGTTDLLRVSLQVGNAISLIYEGENVGGNIIRRTELMYNLGTVAAKRQIIDMNENELFGAMRAAERLGDDEASAKFLGELERRDSKLI